MEAARRPSTRKRCHDAPSLLQMPRRRAAELSPLLCRVPVDGSQGRASAKPSALVCALWQAEDWKAEKERLTPMLNWEPDDNYDEIPRRRAVPDCFVRRRGGCVWIEYRPAGLGNCEVDAMKKDLAAKLRLVRTLRALQTPEQAKREADLLHLRGQDWRKRPTWLRGKNERHITRVSRA